MSTRAGMATVLALSTLVSVNASASPAHLVKNLNKALERTAPDTTEIAEVAGTLYFVGFDSTSGYDLRRSDGTPEGTRLVKDFLDGFGPAGPRSLVSFGNTLFFTAIGGLWKSDGTTEGTVEVASLADAAAIPGITQLTPAQTKLFFMVNEDLWKTDGTATGTTLVRSFAGTPVRRLIALEDKVYVFAGQQTIDLWVSDGTTAGTLRVHNVCASNCGPDPSFIRMEAAVVGDTLFFAGSDALTGVELWSSDGTESGTGIFADIHPGPDSSSPGYLATVAGKLFFSAQDGTFGRSLWVSEGAQPTLRRVKAVAAERIFGANGLAFFVGFEETSGVEPWVSDGTEQGTHVLKDLCPGPCSSGDSFGRAFRESAGFAFFVAFYNQLWRSDGTDEGTALVQAFGGVDLLVGAGTRQFYFFADGEIWMTSGFPEGTVQLTNGVAEGGANLSSPTRVNDRVHFVGLERPGSESFGGWYIWQSDGTEQETTKYFESWPNGLAEDLTPVAGRLLFRWGGALFAADRPGTPAVQLSDALGWQLGVVGDVAFFNRGYELWRTDGTQAGTRLVKNTGGQLAQLTPVRGLLFFTSWGSLWRTDGTTEGTFLVRPDGAVKLFAFKGELYFLGSSYLGLPAGLWKSDGTRAGTVPVVPGFAVFWGGPVIVAGKQFFYVGSDEAGTELWRSDGTPEGTRRVKDIRPGPLGSMAPWPPQSPFANLHGTVFFTADDGAHGRELWRSDGTEAGTVMVKDISPGLASSTPSDLTNVYGTLYLAASDGLAGRELWRSDGTAEGTFLVQDIALGPGSSSPGSFTAAGRRLFFKADDGETGSELWALDLMAHDVALLTGPSPGSTLAGATASFVWEAGDEASEYWLTVKNVSSGKLIYSASEGTGLRRTVSGLPFDGSRIVVQLWSRLPSGWEVLDYSYDAAAPTLAEITAPVPGTTLTSSVTTFSWSPGVAVSAYWLQVGTSLGGRQLYSGSSVTTRSATVSGLPIDGSAVYVRLWSLVAAAWRYRDFTYTAVTAVTEKARMITPPPGSVLSGATVTFTWDAGVWVAAYWLDVGTTPGGVQISRGSRVTSLSAMVARIPTNGSPVYARLWSEIGGRWSYNDYAYTAFSSISLAVSAVTVSPGQPLQVIVQGSPGNPRDWVGLYRSDSPESTYLDWQYLSGTRVPPAAGVTSARLTFSMPTVAGTYEFRLLANEGFTRLATSTRVTVEAVVPLLRIGEATIGPGQAAHVSVED